MREAHQKVLAPAATLKGEIERLSHPLPQSQPEVRARLKSRDCQTHGATECKRRCHQVRFTNSPTPCHPPRESLESSKGEATAEDLRVGRTARIRASGYLLP